MDKKRLVYISMIASPHIVKFCAHLRKYYDAEFYFYDSLKGGQSFWNVELGEHCHVLATGFKWKCKYFTWSVIRVLRHEKPDIVMLGSFSVPANILAYWWARRHGCKTIVFTERSRRIADGKLRTYGIGWRILHFIYRNVDKVFVVSNDAVPQFRDSFRFGDKVRVCDYPADIDSYFKHPLRGMKEEYTIIYPNRMTDIYNPVMAVEIFKKVLNKYPNTKMVVNAAGELRDRVENKIRELGMIGSIRFLDNVKKWDDLGAVYRESDIMILPAAFSNGNYTLIECAVSGMACIISDKVMGDNAKILCKSGGGFVLPVDVDVFADKICWVIEHPEVLQRMAEINRKNFRSYTMVETAARYHALIEGE